MLFNSSTHITEPYFILDAAYAGSGKSCSTDLDCLEANLANGREMCYGRWCSHPSRPRIMMLRPSCTVLGTDSKFFTKRSEPIHVSSTITFDKTPTTKIIEKKENNDLGVGIAIGILAASVVILLAIIFFIIFREKRGSPVFNRFK